MVLPIKPSSPHSFFHTSIHWTSIFLFWLMPGPMLSAELINKQQVPSSRTPKLSGGYSGFMRLIPSKSLPHMAWWKNHPLWILKGDSNNESTLFRSFQVSAQKEENISKVKLMNNTTKSVDKVSYKYKTTNRFGTNHIQDSQNLVVYDGNKGKSRVQDLCWLWKQKNPKATHYKASWPPWIQQVKLEDLSTPINR